MRRTAVWVTALLVACAGAGFELRRAERDLEAGEIDAAVDRLEPLRDRSPESAEVRNALGIAYYRRARSALDVGRSGDYERDLELALGEWIETLRIDPASPTPHSWMGIVAAYQGDLDGALRSFRNSYRLAPHSWVSLTNVAQTLIYRGRVSQARLWLRKAERLGPNPAVIEMNLALAGWRDGDLTEARDLFESAYRLDPVTVNNWDEAPVAEPIETFEDFTSYCCSNPACGPYMEVACRQLHLEVARRQVRDETLMKELRLEMDRRRKLREIYRNRKDLKIEVEPPKPVE